MFSLTRAGVAGWEIDRVRFFSQLFAICES